MDAHHDTRGSKPPSILARVPGKPPKIGLDEDRDRFRLLHACAGKGGLGSLTVDVIRDLDLDLQKVQSESVQPMRKRDIRRLSARNGFKPVNQQGYQDSRYKALKDKVKLAAELARMRGEYADALTADPTLATDRSRRFVLDSTGFQAGVETSSGKKGKNGKWLEEVLVQADEIPVAKGPAYQSADMTATPLNDLDGHLAMVMVIVQGTAFRGDEPDMFKQHIKEEFGLGDESDVFLRFRKEGSGVTRELFCEFMRHLHDKVKGHVIVFLDNGRFQKGREVDDLCKSLNIHLVYTPPGCSSISNIHDLFPNLIARAGVRRVEFSGKFKGRSRLMILQKAITAWAQGWSREIVHRTLAEFGYLNDTWDTCIWECARAFFEQGQKPEEAAEISEPAPEVAQAVSPEESASDEPKKSEKMVDLGDGFKIRLGNVGVLERDEDEVADAIHSLKTKTSTELGAALFLQLRASVLEKEVNEEEEEWREHYQGEVQRARVARAAAVGEEETPGIVLSISDIEKMEARQAEEKAKEVWEKYKADNLVRSEQSGELSLKDGAPVAEFFECSHANHKRTKHWTSNLVKVRDLARWLRCEHPGCWHYQCHRCTGLAERELVDSPLVGHYFCVLHIHDMREFLANQEEARREAAEVAKRVAEGLVNEVGGDE